MKPTIVLKIGSSIVSNGDILAENRIAEISAFIAKLREKFHIILVSSGAVASGFTRINLDKSALPNKRALASVGQPLLIAAYNRALAPFGITAAQLLFLSDVFESSARVAYTKETIATLFANGLLPILNENDAMAQNDLTFGDNDQLSAYVAHYFDAALLVILSDVYGYFDANPLEKKDAKLIKNVSEIRPATLNLEKKASGRFATGGITTKLMAADFLLKHRRKMFLCSGFDLAPTLSFLLENRHDLGTLFAHENGVVI